MLKIRKRPNSIGLPNEKSHICWNVNILNFNLMPMKIADIVMQLQPQS